MMEQHDVPGSNENNNNVNPPLDTFSYVSHGHFDLSERKTIFLSKSHEREHEQEKLKLRSKISALTSENQPPLLAALAKARQLIKVSEIDKIIIMNILNKIKLPHLLWDKNAADSIITQLTSRGSKKNFSLDNKLTQTLFLPIINLIGEIKTLAETYKNKYPVFVAELEIIIKEYEFYIKTFQSILPEKQYLMLKDTPATITAFGIGTRLLKPELVDKFLPTNSDGVPLRSNKMGGHVVNFFENVYYKISPDAPGIEYFVDCINKLVSGQGSPPTLLLSIQKGGIHYSVLASLGVPGKTLDELLTSQAGFLQQIDAHNFSAMIVSGSLAHHQDAKGINYIGSDKVNDNNNNNTNNSSKIIISNIDQDMAFVDPICAVNKTKKETTHWVEENNILNFFPQMKDDTEENLKKDLAKISSMIICLDIIASPVIPAGVLSD